MGSTNEQCLWEAANPSSGDVPSILMSWLWPSIVLFCEALHSTPQETLALATYEWHGVLSGIILCVIYTRLPVGGYCEGLKNIFNQEVP